MSPRHAPPTGQLLIEFSVPPIELCDFAESCIGHDSRWRHFVKRWEQRGVWIAEPDALQALRGRVDSVDHRARLPLRRLADGIASDRLLRRTPEPQDAPSTLDLERWEESALGTTPDSWVFDSGSYNSNMFEQSVRTLFAVPRARAGCVSMRLVDRYALSGNKEVGELAVLQRFLQLLARQHPTECEVEVWCAVGAAAGGGLPNANTARQRLAELEIDREKLTLTVRAMPEKKACSHFHDRWVQFRVGLNKRFPWGLALGGGLRPFVGLPGDAHLPSTVSLIPPEPVDRLFDSLAGRLHGDTACSAPPHGWMIWSSRDRPA